MAVMTESAQSDIQMRLRRIEGQIRGIIGMLADGKPPAAASFRNGPVRAGDEIITCPQEHK